MKRSTVSTLVMTTILSLSACLQPLAQAAQKQTETQQATLSATEIKEMEKQQLFNTSLLTLGILGNTLQKSGEAGQAQQIKDRITDVLWSGQEEKLPGAIYALGNTGDKDAWTNLEWFLADKPESVRLAAVRALAGSAGEQPLAIICKQLENDESARVRIAAIDALESTMGKEVLAQAEKAEEEALQQAQQAKADGTSPDNALAMAEEAAQLIELTERNLKKALKIVGDRLPQEESDQVRVRMVRFIAQNGDDTMDQVLRNQLKSDSSQDVKKEIYRALSSS